MRARWPALLAAALLAAGSARAALPAEYQPLVLEPRREGEQLEFDLDAAMALYKQKCDEIYGVGVRTRFYTSEECLEDKARKEARAAAGEETDDELIDNLEQLCIRV